MPKRRSCGPAAVRHEGKKSCSLSQAQLSIVHSSRVTALMHFYPIYTHLMDRLLSAAGAGCEKLDVWAQRTE